MLEVEDARYIKIKDTDCGWEIHGLDNELGPPQLLRAIVDSSERNAHTKEVGRSAVGEWNERAARMQKEANYALLMHLWSVELLLSFFICRESPASSSSSLFILNQIGIMRLGGMRKAHLSERNDGNVS